EGGRRADLTSASSTAVDTSTSGFMKNVTWQLEVCNACRYCEGYCAVFPALERRRSCPRGHPVSGQPVFRLSGLLLCLHVRAAPRVWCEHPAGVCSCASRELRAVQHASRCTAAIRPAGPCSHGDNDRSRPLLPGGRRADRGHQAATWAPAWRGRFLSRCALCAHVLARAHLQPGRTGRAGVRRGALRGADPWTSSRLRLTIRTTRGGRGYLCTALLARWGCGRMHLSRGKGLVGACGLSSAGHVRISG